jgi:hypothetical protein
MHRLVMKKVSAHEIQGEINKTAGATGSCSRVVKDRVCSQLGAAPGIAVVRTNPRSPAKRAGLEGVNADACGANASGKHSQS